MERDFQKRNYEASSTLFSGKIDRSLAEGYKGIDKKKYQELIASAEEKDRKQAEKLELINQIPEDQIGFITIEHRYRAKNSFGALDLHRFEIRYFLDEKPGKRFSLYSTKGK